MERQESQMASHNPTTREVSAIRPVRVTIDVRLPVGVASGGGDMIRNLLLVPPRRRLVIEFVSCRGHVEPNDSFVCLLVFPVPPDVQEIVAVGSTGPYSFKAFAQASQQVKLYVEGDADGRLVQATVARTVATLETVYSVTISGYLVDL